MAYRKRNGKSKTYKSASRSTSRSSSRRKRSSSARGGSQTVRIVIEQGGSASVGNMPDPSNFTDKPTRSRF